MARTYFRMILALTILVSTFLSIPVRPAQAATFRNRVAQVPAAPTSTQSVRVWMQSDTAFGETAGIEYNIGSSYIKVLGTFDTSGPAPANWRADIPAQPNGTFVRYQLFTRNQSGSDYGFTGFNWSYTVDDGDIQWNGLKHDSFDSYYRSPFGAVTAGTPVTLRFRTLPLDVEGVSVRVYTYNPATNATTGPVDHAMTYLEDRVEGSTNYAIWTVSLATPASPAILYYKFRVTDRLDVDWYSDNGADDHDNLGQGGTGQSSDNEPFPAFQLTVYDPAFQTPAWLQNASVYQIFPDRFRNGDPTNDYCRDGVTNCPVFYGNPDIVAHTTWNEAIHDPRQAGPYFNDYGNQFYGGDLKGIEDKLDYLQGLGIDTLYLTPIFAGRSNHRYDTDDYLTVDPALGGDAAFQSLVQAMEQRGMYLILDGVFNHTSSDSLYFDRYHRYASDGACESLSSQYRSWFNFHNTDAPCGTGDYEGWFGFESLAVLTDNSAAVRDFIYRNGAQNVVKHWYDAGLGGWRFDVADEISHDWWRDFRSYAKSYNPAGPLVGEVWPDASRFLLGEQLDSVMNYRFRKNVLGFARDQFNWTDNDNNGGNIITALSPSQFDHALRSVREDYPPPATAAMLNLIDSHDTNRALYVLTLLGDSGLTQATQRLKLTALFQFTYIGAPMVYYGDEAGIDSPSVANGSNGPEDDPYNRAPYPWADEAGDANIYGPADTALIAYYSQLAHLRQQTPALRTGSFATVLTGDTTASGTDNDTYAFARSGGQTAIIALNQGGGSNTASLPVSAYFADGTQLQDALGGGTYTVSGGNVNVTLAARSGVVLLPAPAAADTTAPSAGISLSPAPTASGWNNSPVTATLTGTDGESGIRELRYWLDNGSTTVVSTSTASVGVSTDGTTVSVRAIDNAGNGSSVASTTVRIDTAPPTIGGTAEPAPSAAGWNNTDVTVTWTCEDALSGVETCSAPATVTGEGSGLSASGSATDKAGNLASASVTGINIDRTAPVTSANAPGGWNNTSVEVVLTASDALSGVASTYYEVDGGPAQTGSTATISGEGEHTLTYWSVDNAGNEETPGSLVIRIDETAPGISFTQDPQANANGWNNSDVTVTFECSDSGSGLAECSGPQTVTTEGAAQPVDGSASDSAGNSSTATASVNIDKTTPGIAAAPDRAPNAAGWYDSDVVVSFTCTDELSGIAECPAAQTVSEGADQSASGIASDAAGNTAAAEVTGLNVDRTAPVIGATLTTDGNPYTPGTWSGQDVEVTFTCSDALSGVASLTGPVTLGEGTGQSAAGTCEDQAGNSASLTVTDIQVDKTAPTISGMPDPAPNAAGWNNTDVTVAWTCTDALSGVETCPAPSAVTGEGSGLTASGSAADNAGNLASTSLGGINIDRTAPTVTVTGVSDGSTYALGSVPAAGCSTTDALSGVAAPASLSVSGGSPDGTGTFTATCSGGVDQAGNPAGSAAATYTVTRTFNFSGFFQPVDNPPTLNQVNSGRGVPLKFSLDGNQGMNIFAAGYPASQQIACSTSAPIDVLEQTVTAGASGLTYDAASDTYTYVWKTETAWANTCRRLVVRLSDGTDHVALFKFVK